MPHILDITGLRGLSQNKIPSYEYRDSIIKIRRSWTTVFSLSWESPYLERQSLYWNGTQFSYHAELFFWENIKLRILDVIGWRLSLSAEFHLQFHSIFPGTLVCAANLQSFQTQAKGLVEVSLVIKLPEMKQKYETPSDRFLDDKTWGKLSISYERIM